VESIGRDLTVNSIILNGNLFIFPKYPLKLQHRLRSNAQAMLNLVHVKKSPPQKNLAGFLHHKIKPNSNTVIPQLPALHFTEVSW
jgi:hypothetical protein